MTRSKLKTPEAKTVSTLMKDINRIKKQAEAQTKMNILRKYQINQLNDFLKKLLEENRITKDELAPYMQRKKAVEKKLFKKQF